MLTEWKSICFIFLMVFGTVKLDFLTINWNISTDRDNSHFEREFKYPLHREVASVACDLTDFCDLFCRQDSDCDNLQKLNFPSVERSDDCDGVLSRFYCGCDKFDKPEWQSLFCYVFKNPVYLGKFYKTQKKIEKYGVLKNLIDLKRYLFYQNRRNEDIKHKISNQYGSPIMTFVPVSEAFPSVNPIAIKTPLKDSSFACKLNSVKYRFNHLSVCLVRITQELCQNGLPLSVLPYLVQRSNSSSYSDMPIVLRDLDFLRGVNTEVSIKCVKLKLTTKKFRKQSMSYFQKTIAKPCEDSFSTYRTVLNNNTCHSVLVYVQHEFILNGSEIVKLKVEYELGDVLFPVGVKNFSDDVDNKYIYLKQKFSVNFFDIMVKVSDKNISINNELFNRGYFVGEELNFGFKNVNNSATTWEKGILGVFKNGDTCDDFSPVSFGFNTFSVCRIRAKFSNCSFLRNLTEEKFESLLKGDSLAIYGNLRPPYNNTVPLLRNFGNSSEEDIANSEDCVVPVTQNILIQYTSKNIPNGRIVHRILGVRADRSFKKISQSEDIALTSRVSFLYVTSFEDKFMSKFWKKMYSSEQSENSWLYIFNAFDDVTSSEGMEITFWSILLIFLTSAAFAFTKLDLGFFEPLFFD